MLNRLAGRGGSPGVGGLEGEGDIDGEREGASGRMPRAIGGGGPFGVFLVRFGAEPGGRGGGGGSFDFASGRSRFLEEWLCAGG